MGLIASISKEILLVFIVFLIIISTLVTIIMSYYKKKIKEQSLQIDKYKMDSVRNLELRQSFEMTQRQLNSLSKQYDKIDLKNKEIEAKNVALLAQVSQSKTGMEKSLSYQQQIALQLENTQLKEDLSLLTYGDKETSQESEITKLREIIGQLEQNNLELSLQVTQKNNEIEKLNMEPQSAEHKNNMLIEKLTKSESNNQKLKEIIMQQATQLMQLKKEIAQAPLNSSEELEQIKEKNNYLEMVIAKNQIEYQEKITVLAKKMIEVESRGNAFSETAFKNQIEALHVELNQQKMFAEEERQNLEATIVVLQKELAEKEDIKEDIQGKIKEDVQVEVEVERLKSMLEQKTFDLSEQQQKLQETLQDSAINNERLHCLENEVKTLNAIILNMETNMSSSCIEKENLSNEIELLNQQINKLKLSSEHANHSVLQENKKLKDKLIQLKSVIGNAFDS